jgi:ADP-ribose pyrophosphatase YjhB (NUDIX family)
MANPPDTFCSRCGTPFESTDEYPRLCVNAECGLETWANPVPVAVVLVPVERGDRTGLLVIRRGIEPSSGFLAIVGGFVDVGETWQAAAVREVSEETGVDIAAELEPFWFTSTEPNPNRVLLFAAARPIAAADLAAFEPTSETTERGAVFGPDGLDEIFAFPLHAEAARRWFAARQISGAHDYAEL